MTEEPVTKMLAEQQSDDFASVKMAVDSKNKKGVTK